MSTVQQRRPDADRHLDRSTPRALELLFGSAAGDVDRQPKPRVPDRLSLFPVDDDDIHQHPGNSNCRQSECCGR